MLVDSHCHLNCLELSQGKTLTEIIAEAEQQGVSHYLCVAIDYEHWQEILAIANQFPQVKASVGVHPNEWEGVDPTVEMLVQAAEHPEVVAIGETGLDYYRVEADLQTRQQERFCRHITAAKISQKPLIIHTRAAEADTLRLMREQAVGLAGVMHCFTGTLAMAKAALDLNFYISISGIVTFKNAVELQELVRFIPRDRLLIETDAPYLAPVPMRGKPNVPAYLPYTARFLADWLSMDFAEFAAQTTENYLRLFKLDK